MKKILALVLAVLVLGSITAFADNSEIYTLADPVVDFRFSDSDADVGESGQNITHLDLAGLKFAVSSFQDNGEYVITFNVLGNNDLLFAATVRSDGSRLLIDVDGMSHTYSVSNFADLFGSSSLSDVGVNFDATALLATVMENVETVTEGETIKFSLPYTAVYDIVDQLLPPSEYADSEVYASIQQLKDTNSGIAFNGSIISNDTGFDTNVKAVIVENGKLSDETFADLTISAYDSFTFDLTIIGDIASAHGSFSPSNGLVELRADWFGSFCSVSFVVGTEEGRLIPVNFGNPSSAIDIESMSDEDTQTATNELMNTISGLIDFLSPTLEAIF